MTVNRDDSELTWGTHPCHVSLGLLLALPSPRRNKEGLNEIVQNEELCVFLFLFLMKATESADNDHNLPQQLMFFKMLEPIHFTASLRKILGLQTQDRKLLSCLADTDESTR